MSSDSEGELKNLVGGGKKQKGCCCSRYPICCGSVSIVTLILSLTIGIFAAVYHPTIHQKVLDTIADQTKLTQGSPATDEFRSSSSPIYTTYYFFNITNPDEIANHGAKPILKQMGPYVFRENRTCFNLRWSDGDTKLHYDAGYIYIWDKEASKGNNPDKDIVTTLNVPLMAVFQQLDGIENKFFKDVIKAIDKLKKISKWDGLFIRRNVSSLLWGYTDPLLMELHIAHHYFHFIPDAPSTTFAFANNDHVETPNIVYTGVGNLSNVSKYIEWNNNTKMGWSDPRAAMINGTGGYAFHPGLSQDEKLMVFIDDIYRSGYFTFDSVMVYEGITLYKFVLPDEELKNKTQVESGFPSYVPNGVLNLTEVVPENVPLFASKPHFLHADPVYLQNVSGLHPDSSIHDSYLGVEPITGISMNVAKRIQLNFQLNQSNDIPELKNLPDVTMLPIFYAEQRGIITESSAKEFRDKVYGIINGISGGVWALVGLAGLISVVSSMCLTGIMVQQYRRRQKLIKNRTIYRSVNSADV